MRCNSAKPTGPARGEEVTLPESRRSCDPVRIVVHGLPSPRLEPLASLGLGEAQLRHVPQTEEPVLPLGAPRQLRILAHVASTSRRCDTQRPCVARRCATTTSDA